MSHAFPPALPQARSQLFTPYSLGPLSVPNRIAVAPMCQYSAEDGLATDWHMIHLGQLALSGAGLLMTEATAVSPEGRISAWDLGLWSDAHQAALAPVVQAIRKHSRIPLAVQLGHAGRKASSRRPWEGGGAVPLADGGWRAVAPSAVPHTPGDEAPLALDGAGMRHVVDGFAAAARRVHALGIDAIEVHGAHGYLLHQFLSPLSNQRSDEYGGALENRMRFPLDVLAAVRAAVPASVCVGMRISATDWVEGGWDIEQSVVFAQALRDAGADFIHVSSGGLSPLQQIPLEPGYQIPFARRIRQATGLPTIGVGLVTEAEHAEAIVAQGDADVVALARAMLYDPRWPWHAAAALGAQVDAPPQYWRSQPRGLKELFGPASLGRA